jgi:hypothetical protein
VIYWGKCNRVGVRVDEGYPHKITIAAQNANGVGHLEIEITNVDLPDLQHLLGQATKALAEKSK